MAAAQAPWAPQSTADWEYCLPWALPMAGANFSRQRGIKTGLKHIHDAGRDRIMMRSVGLVFIYCLSLFLLPGCGQKKANKQDKQEYSQAVNYKMDSINTRIRCFFVTNPDSSEILLLLALNELDTLDYPERKFYVLLGLAEFYQNYKPNYMRAIDFITQAIEMYLKHPQKILLNTYAFIDIGNLFYNLHYYPQAISFYRIATEIE
ncbi:MAG: hypothetical protein WC886_08575, partial [Saccharofermentanaceae bacterium]